MASSEEKAVLVTGAAGFIGGACLEEFLAAGWRVTALVHRRVTPRLARLEEEGRLSLVRGSICRRDRVRAALADHIEVAGRGFDALVHCAGRASDLGPDRLFRRVNLEGTANLVECMERLPLGRLVHLSTTDVYGVKDFRGCDEGAPLERRPLNPYPRYKILAERVIREGLPPERRVILRPAFVWGPGDTTIQPRVLAFLRASPWILHFGRWRGTNRWPLAWIGNLTRLVRLAATCPETRGRTYNVVDPDRVSLDEYYRLLLAIHLPGKKPPRSVTLPLWVGLAVGGCSTLLANLLRRDRPLFDPTLYGLRHAAADQDFSSSRAQQLLARHGLTLTPTREAMEVRATAERGK